MAGIMLDTRNFVIKSGVRTLKRRFPAPDGRDTIEVKRLWRAACVRTGKGGHSRKGRGDNNFAVAVSDIEGGSSLKVGRVRDAGDLNSGLEASFVVVTMDRTVNISARSFGKVNVQVIMEKLGGGGHFTMSAQLPGSPRSRPSSL